MRVWRAGLGFRRLGLGFDGFGLGERSSLEQFELLDSRFEVWGSSGTLVSGCRKLLLLTRALHMDPIAWEFSIFEEQAFLEWRLHRPVLHWYRGRSILW